MNIEYVDTIVVHTALSNTVSESATICIHICMYVYVCMRRCLCKVAHSFLALLLGSSAGIIIFFEGSIGHSGKINKSSVL